MTSSGNVWGDEISQLRNAGTIAGAPLWDFDGNPRGAAPDIGPREHSPD
jgi:hypothetical protein